MFDVENFYNESNSGKKLDISECLGYIKSFKKVIIWGAGNLGTVIGKSLQEQGITDMEYWDMRHTDIKMLNGVSVYEPFSNIDDKSDVLVIFCVTNAFLSPKLLSQLQTERICYLKGLNLYQAMVCPVSLESFNSAQCSTRKECNIAICEKLGNIIYDLNKNENKLVMQSLDVYVTQKCSLKCKYCYIYENSYSEEKKVNFPTERILDDIDIICDVASFIKRIVPFGGEPFLHPDIDVIVAKMASKKNIGIIDIISNGIFSRSEETLRKLNFPNVRIDISNYNMSLDEKLIKIREDNCKLLKDLGLNVTIHNDTPQWRKPGVLKSCNMNKPQLIEKRKNCANFANAAERNNTTIQTFVVKNGRFYPCQHCDTIHNLGIADYSSDYVLLSKKNSTETTINQINKLLNEPLYGACNHCNPSVDLVERAGLQGFDEIYRV